MDDPPINAYHVRWAALVTRVADGRRDASLTIERAHAATRAAREIVARSIGIAVRRDLHLRRGR